MTGSGGSPVTWPTLNGVQFWSASEAFNLLRLPEISVRKTSNPLFPYKATVKCMEINIASFDETILTKPPWNTVLPQAMINSMYGINACSGAGNTTFEARGVPNDNYVYTANRRHEDHHATDHKVAFENTVKPWDAKLTQAMDNGTEYSGFSEAGAKANLWAAMGGTPKQISKAFFDECQAAVIHYHNSPQGGPFGRSGNGSDKTCTTSWVNVTNPS